MQPHKKSEEYKKKWTRGRDSLVEMSVENKEMKKVKVKEIGKIKIYYFAAEPPYLYILKWSHDHQGSILYH